MHVSPCICCVSVYICARDTCVYVSVYLVCVSMQVMSVCMCVMCVCGSSLLPICLWNVCVRDFVLWCVTMVSAWIFVACVFMELGLYFVCGMCGSL